MSEMDTDSPKIDRSAISLARHFDDSDLVAYWLSL